MKPTLSRSVWVIFLRLILLFLVGGFLWWLGTQSSVADRFTIDALRSTIRDAGAAGGLLFVLMFIVGLMMQIPGLIFLLVGILAWGQIGGAAISFVAGVIATIINFYFLRAVGGQPGQVLKWSWAQKLIAAVEKRPIRTVVIIRIALFMSPPANYALALSPVKLKHFILGTVIGLPIPLISITLSFEWFLQKLAS